MNEGVVGYSGGGEGVCVQFCFDISMCVIVSVVFFYGMLGLYQKGIVNGSIGFDVGVLCVFLVGYSFIVIGFY